MDWLPPHKCGLYLTHNEHRDWYESIEDFIANRELAGDFPSEEEHLKAVAEDSLWVLHWYPETPIGFHRVAASSLEAIKLALEEGNFQ